MGNGVFSILSDINGAVYVAILCLVLTAFLFTAKITKLSFIGVLVKLLRIFTVAIGKHIYKKEEKFRRDLEIGNINKKRNTYKMYSFLSDLTIDLNLMHKGVTPYELQFIVMFSTLILTLLGCKIMFGTFFMTIPMYPVVLIGVFSLLYTRANLAHDQRIENVIEAENIICNNIKGGVVAAVRDSIDVIPKKLKPTFRQFLDNIEQQNYHIKTALMELNRQLGSVSDDFIKKCIVFELEEEHGIAGMFADIVEINGITLESRIDMKRAFEQVKFEFRIAAGMIFTFLAGVIVIFPEIRHFYFKHWLGNLIIAIDILIMIIEYVILTSLRAKEL